ncbi:ribonucleotide reductase [Mycolicibacterium sphagni]|uniref:Ribonucleotide reductase n=1 Tax=Mycolicibacterium sphagni TaxID=1786 RepID=A0ABX2K625_9MYCO|nr:ribonucleotide reductase [Mycolicibacterium sphagni]NTY63197.1 ribonucleotide reductase [Mycolicibacterium sphagni]
MRELEAPGSVDYETTRWLLRPDSIAITRADLRGARGEAVSDDLSTPSTFVLLYREYLRYRWDVFELAFSQDHEDWTTAMTADERESFLGIAVSFHHGSRQLEIDLPVFMIGAAEEHRLHLAAQIETQARHTTFFGRFLCEAVGVQCTNAMELLDQTFPWVQETFIGPFGLLAHQAEELGRKPDDQLAQVRYGTTCFLWIEGVLAKSFLSVLMGFAAGRGLLPTFLVGARATYLDHSRQVRGGLLFLQDALRRDPAVVSEIHDTLHTILTVSGVSSRRSFHEPLGWSEDEMRLLVCSHLRRRCDVLGIALPADLENLLVPIQQKDVGG